MPMTSGSGGAPAPPGPTGSGRLARGPLAVGSLDDALATLVPGLVLAHLGHALVVEPVERLLDLLRAEFVVARPRLLATQRVDLVEDALAVAVLALVGVDLGQVDLREVVELRDDLVGVQVVVVGDRDVALVRHGTLGLALGVRDSRDLARLARGAAGAVGRPAGGVAQGGASGAGGVGGADRRGVEAPLVLEL